MNPLNAPSAPLVMDLSWVNDHFFLTLDIACFGCGLIGLVMSYLRGRTLRAGYGHWGEGDIILRNITCLALTVGTGSVLVHFFMFLKDTLPTWGLVIFLAVWGLFLYLVAVTVDGRARRHRA